MKFRWSRQRLGGLVFQVGAVDEMLLDTLLKHGGPMITAALEVFRSQALFVLQR